MPAGVLPDQKQSLLAPLLELLAAPPKKLRAYSAHRTTIDEPQPALFKLGQIHPVAGEGLRSFAGLILSRLLLQKMHRLCGIRPRVQARSLEAGEPALLFESQSPIRMGFGEPYQPIWSPFLRAYWGSGLSIQRSLPSPSAPQALRALPGWSLATELPLGYALLKAHLCGVLQCPEGISSLPNFLGSWWSDSQRASLRSSSKARWVCFGGEEPATREHPSHVF